jgi:ATP-binding cassette subfamily C protein
MARKAGQRQTESFQSLLVRLTDLLNGIKSIKAMARENQVRPLLEEESKNLKRALRQQVLSSQMLKILQEPILILFMAIGIYFILNHRSVPMTNFMVMAFLFYRTVNRIGSVQKQVQTMAIHESAYWSFHNRLKKIESAAETLSGGIQPELNHQIAFENVCFSYGEKEIIKNVSFTIPYGRLTVITGLSGAGKTTIADMLTGLVRPKVGDVLVDDIPFSQIDLGKWRHMIGYVPQEMFLFHETVYANVSLGDDSLTRHDVEEALRKAEALDFASALPLGLDSIIGERGSKISGGQRQRISVARALVRKPRLLILDEVTTALDPKTEAALCSTILGLRGEMAILAISHQPSMVESADLVYRLERGQMRMIEKRDKQSIGVIQ